MSSALTGLSRPPRFDVVLAVVLAVLIVVLFAVGANVSDGQVGISVWSFTLGPLAALLLMFRRVRPVTTLLAIAAVLLTYVIIVQDGGPIGIPIWIGLYTVAAEGSRRNSVFAAVATALVVSTASFLVAPESPTLLEQAAAVGLSVLPIAVGDAVRSRRALIAEADERVRLAEAATEREAQRRVQDERVRIARELHDVVAHSIATINVQAGVAAHVIDANPAGAKEALTDIKGASKMAMAEMRAMLGVLHANDDEEGEAKPLAPSQDIGDVEDLVERFAGASSFEVSGTAAQLVDPAVGLVVYRVIQEALTNSLKHAEEAFVDVAITYEADQIGVRVYDDGGHGRRDDTDGSGLGLVGLEERARSIGGTFSAAPRFDGGFEVLASVPYSPRQPI